MSYTSDDYLTTKSHYSEDVHFAIDLSLVYDPEIHQEQQEIERILSTSILEDFKGEESDSQFDIEDQDFLSF